MPQIEPHLRLHFAGDYKADDDANKEAYQSDKNAVNEPSRNCTDQAEEHAEDLLLLV
ncbi:hypothetical protein [Mycobacterium colombiense]|uniref:hypothetical protein n=1 Tax=Mycobacterium colombiense TaxID=339268 RepID=UPI00200A3FC4|nr:hypothetical protein [Mycobacterium colombiense]MCK8643112.1 hypothetical protein [Mycobacterium colombiense]